MRRMKALLLGAVVASGCATHFKGDAHFPGGARGCQAACQRDGMVMSSFVYSGEFASSCVCRPPDHSSGAPGESSQAVERDVAVVAPAIGVVLQSRRSAAAQQQAAAK